MLLIYKLIIRVFLFVSILEVDVMAVRENNTLKHFSNNKFLYCRYSLMLKYFKPLKSVTSNKTIFTFNLGAFIEKTLNVQKREFDV